MILLAKLFYLNQPKLAYAYAYNCDVFVFCWSVYKLSYVKQVANGSVVVVIMDKKSYITEGYRQLNNDNHYENANEAIYLRPAIKKTADGNVSVLAIGRCIVIMCF